MLERLESRVVPSYTFTYNPATQVATAISSGGNNDALVIDQTGGSLEYSLNGSAPSTSWSGQTVPNSAATTVDIIEAKGGTGEVVTIGSSTAPISTITAHVAILSTQTPSSSSLILNDAGGVIPAVGSNAYTANNGTFTGPGPFTVASSVAQTGGVVIDGSPQTDTFNAVATSAGVPVFFGAGAGSSAVNLGNNPNNPASSTLSTIHSRVDVTDPVGVGTLNINDAGDTTSAGGSIDFLSTPSYEVTGLGFASGGKVTFSGGSPGVSNLVVNLGRSGAAGATLNVAGTPAGTTTTINGGGNQNTFSLSMRSIGGRTGQPARPGGHQQWPERTGQHHTQRPVGQRERHLHPDRHDGEPDGWVRRSDLFRPRARFAGYQRREHTSGGRKQHDRRRRYAGWDDDHRQWWRRHRYHQRQRH